MSAARARPGSPAGNENRRSRPAGRLRFDSLEPTLGFEPRTCCLRNSCSTAELCRRAGDGTTGRLCAAAMEAMTAVNGTWPWAIRSPTDDMGSAPGVALLPVRERAHAAWASSGRQRRATPGACHRAPPRSSRGACVRPASLAPTCADILDQREERDEILGVAPCPSRHARGGLQRDHPSQGWDRQFLDVDRSDLDADGTACLEAASTEKRGYDDVAGLCSNHGARHVVASGRAVDAARRPSRGAVPGRPSRASTHRLDPPYRG